jgi:hypothetical protein
MRLNRMRTPEERENRDLPPGSARQAGCYRGWDPHLGRGIA